MRISDWSSDVCSSDLRLDPAAAMAGRVLLRNAPQQQDGFGQHQLGHRTGVGVGRIEHRNAAPASGIEIDLIGADAEARSEERRVGKECVSTGRSRWSTYH